MRVIIISDSKDYMGKLRHVVAALDPEVEVTEHDPEQMGRPDPDFNWSLYDLLIIEERLGGAESGLAWLAMLGITAALPPAVLVVDEIDDFVARTVAGMKAVRLLPRAALDGGALQDKAKQLGVSLQRAAPTSIRDLGLQHDSEIVQNLALAGEENSDQGYKFVRLIGQGAHSRVYLAERLVDQLTLVLKILDWDSIEDPTVSERFAREAELLASIDSSYVIKFYDHGSTPTYGYIAVEFFTRGDLKQRIEHGISQPDALIYALNIAFGLEAIHTLDIVHRDLKPGNIMFRADDSIALADFGISKHIGDSWGLTKTGSILGTLNYLSPEQGLGQPVDQRTDLYGLGMVLFEMLTGEKAFRAGSPSALVYQHLYADVPEMPALHRRYQPIINKLLAKDPNDRYQSASELVANLQPICAALG